MKEFLIGNIKGEKGDDGHGLKILDYYDTLTDLTSNVPNPSSGDAYGIGSTEPYDIYIYSESKGWVNNGQLQGAKGDSAKITEVTANVDNTTGEPDVEVTMGGTDTNRTFHLSFSGLKGEKDTEHSNDATKHITEEERTKWNNKAPEGHGLGVMADGLRDKSFLDFIRDGCGFYQVYSNQGDAPSGTSWLSLFQVVRNNKEGEETGVQITAHDYSLEEPKIWFRPVLTGATGQWFEFLHSGNFSKFANAQVKIDSYIGTGDYTTEGYYARTIPVDFVPKLMIISRSKENEYKEINVIPFFGDIASGMYCYINVIDNHTYARSMFSYDENEKNIKITNNSGVIYRSKVDLVTGFITDRVAQSFVGTSNTPSYAAQSILNEKDEIYDYLIIG